MSLAVITNQIKDAALQMLAAWFLNHFPLRKLGRMTSLKLDSEKQEIALSLELRGEQTPVDLAIRYRVIDSTHIEILEVRSSREWIATAANELVPPEKKQIAVPALVTAALSRLIR